MVTVRTLLNWFASTSAVISLAPVATYLDLPVLLLAIVAVVVGFWFDHLDWHPLPTSLIAFLACAGIVYFANQITRTEMAGPVVQALILLLAIRLLASKNNRDYLQIFLLALFILAGSSLLSLDSSYAIYLVLLVFVVTVGLVMLTVLATDERLSLPHRDLMRLVKVALALPVVSLVLMVFFFMILPRTAHPLWTFLNPAGKPVVGLSESIQPGSVSQIATVKTLAFRADGQALPVEDLYWRVLVLNQPAGNRWVRQKPPHAEKSQIVGGHPVKMTIYPETHNERYLVTLERTRLISGMRSLKDSDQVFLTMMPSDYRPRFSLEVLSGGVLQAKDNVNDFYLSVPENVAPRLAATARKIAASGPDRDGRLAALTNFFRQQKLTYARDNLPVGQDPLDDFLFGNRRGHCEFFASAYVTLARLAGIPARIVGGYYGGEYNALGGYYIVTDDDAHVWAEVLNDAGTWLRIDPSLWAINADVALAANRSKLTSIQRVADALNYFWVQGVLIFDFHRQLELWDLLRGNWQIERPAKLQKTWLFYGVVVVLAWLAFALAKHRHRRGSCEKRLLSEFYKKARKRLGSDVTVESLGLSEMAERLDSDHCREFARIFQGAVFRDRPLTADEIARLKNLLRDI